MGEDLQSNVRLEEYSILDEESMNPITKSLELQLEPFESIDCKPVINVKLDGDLTQTLTVTEEEFDKNSGTIKPSNSKTMSAFLILNSMIGSGIFNQPHVFSQAGLVGATLLLTVASVFVWIGMIALVEVGIYTSTYDYPSLGQVCLGKMGKRLVNWSIIIMGIGSIMSYIVLLGLFSTTLFASWGWSWAVNGGIYLVTSIMVFILILPFCIYRSFGHFAFISVLSMGSVLSILILLLIAGPLVSDTDFRFTKFFAGRETVNQLGSIVFALNCTPSVFPTYNCITER